MLGAAKWVSEGLEPPRPCGHQPLKLRRKIRIAGFIRKCADYRREPLRNKPTCCVCPQLFPGCICPHIVPASFESSRPPICFSCRDPRLTMPLGVAINREAGVCKDSQKVWAAIHREDLVKGSHGSRPEKGLPVKISIASVVVAGAGSRPRRPPSAGSDQPFRKEPYRVEGEPLLCAFALRLPTFTGKALLVPLEPDSGRQGTQRRSRCSGCGVAS